MLRPIGALVFGKHEEKPLKSRRLISCCQVPSRIGMADAGP